MVKAATEGTSDGSAAVGNVAPTVTYVAFWDSTEATNKNNTDIDAWTEYRVNCTVNDNNELYDLENVTFIIWEDTYADEGSADSNVAHYTFRYVNDTDTWDEVGPDAGDSHLVSGSCTDPADPTQTSGEYKLAFKLHKTGNYTATRTWDIKVLAYDGDTSGSNQSIIFGVAFYFEISVTDGTHGWSSLTPGQSNIIMDQPDGDLDLTATANANFDLQAKGDGALTSGSDTIPLGNVKIHETTEGSAVALTVSYADIGDLTNEASGESQAKACILWITVPSGQPQGTYTYTLSIQGVKA